MKKENKKVDLIFNLIRLILLIAVLVFLLLSIKKDDWTQSIFWLLLLNSVLYIKTSEGISSKLNTLISKKEDK